MNTIRAGLGWTLRVSAAICIAWTVGQVLSGQIDTLTVILGSVAWHAAMAVSGVALVGASRRASSAQAASA